MDTNNRQTRVTAYLNTKTLHDLRVWAAKLGVSHGILTRAILERAVSEHPDDMDTWIADGRRGNGRQARPGTQKTLKDNDNDEGDDND